MARKKAPGVYLLVGTKKGAFVLKSDRARRRWALHGPFLKGGEVNDLAMDLRTEPTLYASVKSYWWGTTVQISRDFGKSWAPSEGGIHFPEGSGKNVERIWCVHPATADQSGVLYAGVDPGSMFVTRDGGNTWSEIEALNRHPTRDHWTPGAGGMMVHSICFNARDPKKMFVGISAAGVFATEDGGNSWEPRNKNVRADFLPDKYPQVGQCVHHLEMHPAKPEVLYQQNHCGVYRSDNEGRDWTDISRGLPSRFGFPLQIHPEDPDTLYVIPEQGAEFRCVADNSMAVYRSRNRGRQWQKLGKGLPARNAFLHVHRQALRVDSCHPAGIYIGTSSGHIFQSRDEGKSWNLLIENLPMIYSLNVAAI